MGEKNKKTILLIEDEKAISEIFHHLLQTDGYEVTCRIDGTSAMLLAMEKCYDFIITDYRLPGEDGIAITRWFRVHCPTACIIGISAGNKELDFLEAGADFFLKKPFLFRELVDIITRKCDRE